jgi:poly(beta-D-mannuronate) lyase
MLLALLPLAAIGEGSAAGFACPKMPAISPQMGITSRYYGPSVDATFSTMNPKAVAEQKPVRTRVGGPVVALNRLTSEYVAAQPAERHQIGACIAGLVHGMTGNRYLSEPKSREDRYFRDWLMVAVLADLLSLDETLLDEVLDSPTRAWIKQAAGESDAFFQSQPVDNHYYWSGLSLVLSAAVLKDHSIEEAGQRVLSRGLEQVNQKGMLPAEVARGKRATHYHLFAAVPLAAMQQVVGDREQITALSRLTRTLLLDLRDGASGPIAKVAGPQLPSESLPGLPLLAPYLSNDQELGLAYKAIVAKQSDNFFFLGGSVKRFESALVRSNRRLTTPEADNPSPHRPSGTAQASAGLPKPQK